MLLSPHSRWRHRAGIGDCGPGEPEPALGGPGAPHRCLLPPLPHAPLTRWSNPKLFLPPSFIPAALTAHRPLHSCFGPGGGSGELVHFAASSRDARTPGPAWGAGGGAARRERGLQWKCHRGGLWEQLWVLRTPSASEGGCSVLLAREGFPGTSLWQERRGRKGICPVQMNDRVKYNWLLIR